MTEDSAKKTKVNAGTVPEIVGVAWDAPTILVDGVTAVAVSLHQTKVTFVEHYPTQEKLVGKPVMNVVVANDQFLKIVDTLIDIANTMRDGVTGAVS